MIQNVTRDEVVALLPRRRPDMHKGERGRLLAAGGSARYPGAPSLSVQGALRCGCGLVSLLSLPSVCAACVARLPEAVCRPLEDPDEWLDVALSEASSFGAALLGPGLGRTEAAMRFVAGMWGRWPGPLLVDGDGLYALALQGASCRLREDVVLTPHEGEAARLLGTTPDAVRGDREGAARRLAERWGCVLLKGHGSLLACRGRSTVQRLTWGGPELAVPGSGDVLSGAIGAFLAGGMAPRDAALLGGAVHGMAGEWLAAGGVDGVLASEIADAMRLVLGELRS